MNSNKKKFLYVICLFLIVILIGIISYRNKLTYIEYTALTEQADEYIEIKDAKSTITQRFIAPYNILNKVSLKIGTYARINNSQWIIDIVDTTNNKKVLHKIISAGQIVDNSFYDIKLSSNIALSKGRLYELHISSLNANEYSSLAFYKSSSSIVNNSMLFIDGVKQSGALCFNIYGGERDLWWVGFYSLICLLALGIYVRFISKGANKQAITNDKILQSLILILGVFLLMASFSVQGTFIDEKDNIRGGMIIAHGGMPYRDYVTQHTPVTYYLCAIFALLGAKSIEQFRLLFYLVQSIIWGFLYYRHSAYYGWKKMILLPVFELMSMPVIITSFSNMVLSDNIQGFCMIVLTLEFIRYMDDRKIDWGRCIIASICIWGSFGAAFVSAYALASIAIICIVFEVLYWRKQTLSLKEMCKRYYKLMIAIFFPSLLTIIYFWINNALYPAYCLAYKFNVDVYPTYSGGFGQKKIQPVIYAIQNFFNFFTTKINLIGASQASIVDILGLIIIIMVIIVIINLALQKKYFLSIMLFCMICGNLTRGWDWIHGYAAWQVTLLVIALYWDKVFIKLGNINILIWKCLIVFIFSIYINSVGINLLHEQEIVSELENAVIHQTDDGDGIFIDTYTCDSIYLLYKNRYPVNRNTYFLPWYMEWYEQATISDLNEHLPKVVVYNQDSEIASFTHYSNAFLNELKKNYTQYSEDPSTGWRYSLWIKN